MVIVKLGSTWEHMEHFRAENPFVKKYGKNFIKKRAPPAPFENLLLPGYLTPKLKTFKVLPSAPKCTLAEVNL